MGHLIVRLSNKVCVSGYGAFVFQLKANAHFHKLFLDVPIDEPLKQSKY